MASAEIRSIPAFLATRSMAANGIGIFLFIVTPLIKSMVESLQSRIAKLREEMRKEQKRIIEAARKRRARGRPGEAQKILLWEMNRLRHTEAKYMAAIDKLMKEALAALKPAKPKKFRKIGPQDKRPSQKHKKLSLAK